MIKYIVIHISDDPDSEGQEEFSVQLTGGTNVTVTGSSGSTTITIDDDDNPSIEYPSPKIFVDDTNVNEGATSSTKIRLDQAHHSPIQITWSTINGTALAPSDYNSLHNQSVVIPAGQTQVLVQVPTVGDSNVEGVEYFYVAIQSASEGEVVDGSGYVHIREVGGGSGNYAFLDLDVDSNNDGTIDPVDDPIETSPVGHLVRLNNDDDNENSSVDASETGFVLAEDDLALATLSSYVTGYTESSLSVVLVITMGDDKIDIYDSPQRGTNYASSHSWTWANRPSTLWVEGDVEGDARFRLEIRQSSTVITSDEVLVKVTSVDLDVDSDNDDGIGAPDRSVNEELKEDATHAPGYGPNPGKVVLTNTLDRTANGIPDFADGYNSGAVGLAPDNSAQSASGWNRSSNGYRMVVQVPDWVDLSVANIRFSYLANNPANIAATTRGHGLPDTYTSSSPANHAIRIWTMDLDSPRSKNVINVTQDPGHFVPGNVSMHADKLFSGSNRTVTLYVEGVHGSPDGGVTVRFDLDPFGTGRFLLHDSVKLTSAWVQLVHSDASGIIGDAWQTVTRIATTDEPDGIAADWHPGIDDGSMLYVRLAGASILKTFADQGRLNVAFGHVLGLAGAGGFSSLPNFDNQFDGEFQTISSELKTRLEDSKVNIRRPDELYQSSAYHGTGNSTLSVLDERLYRSPYEFNQIDDLTTADRRRIGLAVSIGGTAVAAQGARPAPLYIVRAPVVLVHGINSDANTWTAAANGVMSMVANDGFRAFTFSHGTQSRGNEDLGSDVTEQPLREAIRRARESIQAGLDGVAQPGIEGLKIALQKADLVAHSYGGLISRWYLEQGGHFNSRRDVRKLITLGTPHHGSPFANMILEIYKNALIGNAATPASHWLSWIPFRDFLISIGFNVPSTPPETLLGLAYMVQAIGWMTFNRPDGSVLPSYHNLAVDSDKLTQLNQNAFRSDVAYRAIVGTDNTIYPGVDIFDLLNPIQVESDGTRRSYFPWLGLFNGSSDGIVPTWSATLGAESLSLDVNHVGMPSSVAVGAWVTRWLAGFDDQTAYEAMPLGSALRPGFNQHVPLSVRNAYDRDGLERDAIVKTEVWPGDTSAWYGAQSWLYDSSATGAQTIALTGMVRHGDISGLAVKVYAESAFGDVVIDFYNPGTPQTGWNIASDQPPSADDYVTYRILNAHIGRTQSQQLVGPMNVSWTGVEQFLSYHLVNTSGGTYAPLGSATPWSRVYVTDYQLPAPTFVATGNPNEYRVTLQGGAESVGNTASQQELVELWQDMLGPNVLVTSAMATLNTNQGVWNRLLLGYSVDVFIVVADPNTPIYVFQYQPRSGESSDNAEIP